MKTINYYTLLLLLLLFGFTAMAQEEENETNTAEQAQPERATIRSNTQYDFVPGDKILLYEDFSQDAIGDFPALWTTDGSGEVRTIENFPGKWLYTQSNEHAYCLMKNLQLPKNFIFEFDVIPTPSNPDEDEINASFKVNFFKSDGDFLVNEIVPGEAGFYIIASTDKWAAAGYRNQEYISELSSLAAPIKMNKLNHVIMWIQNKRLRVYFEGQKIIDGPTAIPENITFNRFCVSMWGQTGYPFFSNLKITTASPDTRNKLLTEGKLITYGIYFDVNKDIVKPESYGALNDIAKVLNEVPDVKVKIVGHTDSDGADAANLDLSKRRAASVKNELVKNFNVNGDRLETDGAGESKPVAPNDTPANKALNRRVEFIKL